MANRPRLTRWDAIWAAGCVAIFLSFGVAARTPYFDLFRVLFATALLLLIISDWRTKGHGWFATLSWSAPLGGLWIISQWLIDGQDALVYWLGFVPLIVIGISTRAAKWWYRVVLRRPYKI